MIQRCHAHLSHCSTATRTTGWLEKLVAGCSKALVAWCKQALRAVEQALATYERTRSLPDSVVPPEEL